MAKVQFPFMVFAESLGGKPETLADPRTSPEEKAEIRADINHSLETVADVGARNRQQGRWATRYKLRDRVMADYEPGKRHEPKRLLKAHPDVSMQQIRKWIAQLRTTAAKPAPSPPTHWRDVYYGEALRHQYHLAGRRPKKPKG
jgi:hypothetical protein